MNQTCFARTVLVGLLMSIATACPAADEAPAKGGPARHVVQIGGRDIVLPAPPGCERADGRDPKMDQMRDEMLGGTNRYVARFEPAAGTDDAAKEREFSVQVMKSVESREIGERTYAEVREQTRAELQQSIEEVQKKLDSALKDQSGKIGKEIGVETALSASDMAVLGFFDDKPYSLGFTMAMNMKAQVGDQMEQSRVVTSCMTVPVNGRLLFLYAQSDFKSEEDRKWGEQAVTAWRDAILAANPRVEGPSASLFDWSSVGRSGLIGGIIGCLVGLVSWLTKKKKANGLSE